MSETDVHEEQQSHASDIVEERQPSAQNTAVAVRQRIGQDVALTGRGGIDYARLTDMVDAARLLAQAGPMLPPWLQNNVGGVFSIIMRAQELGISAISLANWSYVVRNGNVDRVGYESQFFHALIELRAPLEERLRYEIIGEGDERKCRVWGTIIGEKEPRSFTSETLAKLRPALNDKGVRKGSPLWDKKPEVQLFYNASRDFARIYFPDVMGGMYGRDELIEHGGTDVEQIGPESSLAARLPKVAGSAGFDANTISRALGEAPAEQEKPAAAREPAAGKATRAPRKGSTKAAKPQEEKHGSVDTGNAEQADDRGGAAAAAAHPASAVLVSEPADQAEYVAWAERWIGNGTDPDNLEARWDGEKELRAKCRITVTERKRLEGVMKGRVASLRKDGK